MKMTVIKSLLSRGLKNNDYCYLFIASCTKYIFLYKDILLLYILTIIKTLPSLYNQIDFTIITFYDTRTK